MRQYLLSTFSCCIFFLSFTNSCQAQPNYGGTNLFTNSGLTNPSLGNPNNSLNNLSRPTFPLSSDNNENSNWLPATFPAFPLRYLSLPGLTDAEKEILSQNYLVVINDANIKSFAQLYKDNRIDGISSFVTADSIIHPLLVLQNNIKVKVIERSLFPSLESLLISMLHINELDFKDAQDAEFKEEIKYNLAFLTVAIKILLPDFPFLLIKAFVN